MALLTQAHCSKKDKNKQNRCKRKDTFTLQLVLLKAHAISNAENTAGSLFHNQSLNPGFQWASFVTVKSTECLSHIQIGFWSTVIDEGRCVMVSMQVVQSLSITSLIFALAPISPESWSMHSQSELSSSITSCLPSQLPAVQVQIYKLAKWQQLFTDNETRLCSPTGPTELTDWEKLQQKWKHYDTYHTTQWIFNKRAWKQDHCSLRSKQSAQCGANRVRRRWRKYINLGRVSEGKGTETIKPLCPNGENLSREHLKQWPTCVGTCRPLFIMAALFKRHWSKTSNVEWWEKSVLSWEAMNI